MQLFTLVLTFELFSLLKAVAVCEVISISIVSLWTMNFDKCRQSGMQADSSSLPH